MASGESRYRSNIRGPVRGLWAGLIDYGQFFDEMLRVVRDGMTRGWHAGAAECGIKPDELTPEEKTELEKAIAYENQWINGLAETIEENSKANKGKLGPLFSRMEIWIGRYKGIHDKAMVMACGDKKLKWVQGPTSDKCSSCSKLNGKVKRASFWNERGILPRVHGAPYLECNGFRCLCELMPTDDPVSRGPLPGLP